METLLGIVLSFSILLNAVFLTLLFRATSKHRRAKKIASQLNTEVLNAWYGKRKDADKLSDIVGAVLSGCRNITEPEHFEHFVKNITND